MTDKESRIEILNNKIKIEEANIKIIEDLNSSEEEFHTWSMKNNKQMIILGSITLLFTLIIFDIVFDSLSSWNVFSIALLTVTVHRLLCDRIEYKSDHRKKVTRYNLDILKSKNMIGLYNTEIETINKTQ